MISVEDRLVGIERMLTHLVRMTARKEAVIRMGRAMPSGFDQPGVYDMYVAICALAGVTP